MEVTGNIPDRHAPSPFPPCCPLIAFSAEVGGRTGGAEVPSRAARPATAANWHLAHRMRRISPTGILRPPRTLSVILSEALRRTVRHAGLWRRPKNPAPPLPMHARLRGVLGRCGCGGRGWGTPRRTAARRMVRSGILQSRMNAVPGKARRTLLQNDPSAPRWAAGMVRRRCLRGRRGPRRPRCPGELASGAPDASHEPHRDSPPASDSGCHSERGAAPHRPSHRALAPTEESRATASHARPVARRARTLRVRWARLEHATPDRGAADVSVRDSSVAHERGAGESAARAPSE
jgi:hypothetical protein